MVAWRSFVQAGREDFHGARPRLIGLVESPSEGLFEGGILLGIAPKTLSPSACRWFGRKWRRGQDSNLQALSGGGFQDRCTTNYATPPHTALTWDYIADGLKRSTDDPSKRTKSRALASFRDCMDIPSQLDLRCQKDG